MTAQEDIAQALRQAGFTGQALTTAIAISLAETGGTADPGATNPGTPAIPEYSVGPLQINLNAHPNLTEAEARDPGTAARYAYTLSNGGSNFSAWTTYIGGAYRQYLAEAQALATGSPGASTPTRAPGAGQQSVSWIPGADALAAAVQPIGKFFGWFNGPHLWKASLTVLGVSLVVGGGVLYFGGDGAVSAARKAV